MAHRVIVPCVLMLLWGISVCFDFLKFKCDASPCVESLKYGDSFVAIVSLYFIFLVESAINFFDSGLIQIRREFNVHLLYLLSLIVLIMAMIFVFSYLFVCRNEECSALFWGVFVCMMLQKLVNVLYLNNLDFFWSDWTKVPLISQMSESSNIN